MNFENELKQEIQDKIMTNAKARIPNRADSIFFDFYKPYLLDLYEEFLSEKLGVSDNEMRSRKAEEFSEAITDNSLGEMVKSISISDEEMKYIMLATLDSNFSQTNIFRGNINRESSYQTDIALTEILIRRRILEFFTNDSMEDVIKFIDGKNEKYTGLKKQGEYILELIRGDMFQDINSRFIERLDSEVESRFNRNINCGGYALEIDDCVFPYGIEDFDRTVSALLIEFPFIRLLGDSQLGNDEYIVMYRANDKGSGHHFIKVNQDGSITEKNESSPICEFQGWGTLDDCPEAVFAVKKEHDIHQKRDTIYAKQQATNFEQAVEFTIRNSKGEFDYHNRTYILRESNDEEILIYSDKGVVAEVLTDGTECLVQISEGKEKYISNTQPIENLKIEKETLLSVEEDGR